MNEENLILSEESLDEMFELDIRIDRTFKNGDSLVTWDDLCPDGPIGPSHTGDCCPS